MPQDRQINVTMDDIEQVAALSASAARWAADHLKRTGVRIHMPRSAYIRFMWLERLKRGRGKGF